MYLLIKDLAAVAIVGDVTLSDKNPDNKDSGFISVSGVKGWEWKLTSSGQLSVRRGNDNF